MVPKGQHLKDLVACQWCYWEMVEECLGDGMEEKEVRALLSRGCQDPASLLFFFLLPGYQEVSTFLYCVLPLRCVVWAQSNRVK